MEGLCLSGSTSVPPRDAFSNFRGLKILSLNLRLTQLLPGAFRGLGQLQKLPFKHHPVGDLFLSADASGSPSSLQYLSFWGFGLDGNSGVRLPPSLRRLTINDGCLQEVGKLAGIFPDLVLGPSSGDAWILDMLDLSFNKQLKMVSAGALQGLVLGTLKLDHTKMKAAAMMGLGPQRLDALSVMYTDMAELPAGTVAHFELQELNLGGSRIGHIAPEALASCQSRKSLDLKGSGLTDLPPGFLAALPGLQRLHLANNRLQSATLCTNETGAVQDCRSWICRAVRCSACPPAAFSCWPYLRELLLQGKQLVWLEGQAFQGLRRLEMLDLGENPLAALGEGWLAPLPALTTLNLPNTQIVLSSARDFWAPESLRNLRLQFPSGSSQVALSLPTRLTSLELHAVPGRKLWKLASPVSPVLQTLTLNGWGMQLETQNVSKIFPALLQLTLLGNSLEGPSAPRTPPASSSGSSPGSSI